MEQGHAMGRESRFVQARSIERERVGRSRGQMLPLFVVTLLVLLGVSALVIDVSWYWLNNVRMQRAADAAALAGVVYLPGNAAAAYTRANEEALKNGYSNGSDGIVITSAQHPANPRRLDVTVEGPVPTYFMRVFGINTIPARREGNAEYVLPVPMGSPEAYYGTFGTIRSPGGGTTTTTSTSGNTGLRVPGSLSAAGSWLYTSAVSGCTGHLVAVTTDDTCFATRTGSGTFVDTDGDALKLGNFGLTGGTPPRIPVPGANQTLEIDGIEVLLDDVFVNATCTSTYLEVHLSWDGGVTYNAAPSTPTLNDTPMLTTTQSDFVIGSASSTAAYSSRTWTRADFTNANFRVRIRANKGCTSSTTEIRLDQVRVRVSYTLTTSTFVPDSDIKSPYGAAVNARGFWGTMLSQGAEDINGDAYLPYYETRTSALNPDYSPAQYYNYAVVIPPGASGGEVWLFDPVFCATRSDGQFGTGDRWFGSNRGAMSAFYDLYDTNNTPYDEGDDTLVATSGNFFRRSLGSDGTLEGPTGYTGYVSCAPGDPAAPTSAQLAATPQGGNPLHYHNRWWRMATGLAGGRTYRLKTFSTDPSSATDQRGSNGHNSFAIWTRATGGSPRVHGIGAMQNFSPLNGGGASVFYLAQVDAVHAGKTMVIDLWDPGDTGTLTATLEILVPGASGYQAATLNWRAARGTTNANASSCNSLSGTNVTSITTNTGGSSRFNGCWLTIEIPIPIGYTAPQPPGEPEAGWWKIRYDMGGSASDNAFDLTTWQVSIRGNPVHLVLP
jgi:hypothetical protein